MATLREDGGVKLSSTYSSDSSTPLKSRKRVFTNDKLTSEVNRLHTFESWPLRFISKTSLAAAGFYYLNKSDAVKCVFCGLELGSWEEGDDPMQDHKRWSPKCPFVKANETCKGNVNSLKNLKPSNSVCGIYSMEIRPNSYSEIDPNSEQLAFLKPEGPAYPHLASVNLRLKTFEEWPKSLIPQPKELCEAGFYYLGSSDETICFYCGGGLKNWHRTDDPWVEHGRWYSKCQYVIQMKGKDFVNKLSTEEKQLIPCRDMENLKINCDKKAIRCSADNSSSLNSESTEDSIPTTDDGRLCKVCFQEDLGVVTLPCSHLVTCVKCAPSLTHCPVCREKFNALVRVNV